MVISSEIKKQVTIMIVDDQSSNLLFLEKMLSLDGYALVHSLSDSRKAVEMYKELRPDLLLLDLRMPYVDGFEIMKQLGEVEYEDYLPIIVLTAQVDRETRLRALEAGAKDFLSKPLDQAEVLNRIRNLLEIRLLHKQLRGQNEVLERKVQKRTKELHDTQLEVIQRLSLAAEYRDDDTGVHISRMSQYTSLLAQGVGMSPRECELILHATPMHDVGKIGIPDNILLKSGPLNAEEWEIMKTHTTIGARLMENGRSELIMLAEMIALTHHERWNGKGYPSGLEGEEIPLVGRLCSIADVFDALTSKRPYKEAWPVEASVQEIQRMSGAHFEPRLVELFMDLLPEIVKIKDATPVQFNESKELLA